MSDTITLPSSTVNLAVSPRSKWEREFDAFRKMLPALLGSHRGCYVAIHDGKVADWGDDKLALALRVLAKVGNVAIHIGLVSEEPELITGSGIRREMRTDGGFSPPSLDSLNHHSPGMPIF